MWRTSVLIAYPNKRSCRMGSTAIIASVGRSRRIWISSFQAMARGRESIRLPAPFLGVPLLCSNHRAEGVLDGRSRLAHAPYLDALGRERLGDDSCGVGAAPRRHPEQRTVVRYLLHTRPGAKQIRGLRGPRSRKLDDPEVATGNDLLRRPRVEQGPADDERQPMAAL